MDEPKVSRPRHLREALGLAFVHRGRVRWRAGRSAFLGLDYPGEGSGVVVDVGDVAEFRLVRGDRHGLHIGAFAELDTIAREPLVRNTFGESPFGAEAAGFRLAVFGARLVIAGAGATRTAPFEAGAARALPPNEIPLAVTLPADLPKIAFADRRIRRVDGVASFELRVFVALAFAGFHRIGTANVAYSLDGGPPVALPEVIAHLSGTMVARGSFAVAARHAADSFRGDDEKTNVLRRTVMPLVLSALKEAYDAARRDEPPARLKRPS